jgi:hypothetical protein
VNSSISYRFNEKGWRHGSSGNVCLASTRFQVQTRTTKTTPTVKEQNKTKLNNNNKKTVNENIKWMTVARNL